MSEDPIIAGGGSRRSSKPEPSWLGALNVVFIGVALAVISWQFWRMHDQAESDVVLVLVLIAVVCAVACFVLAYRTFKASKGRTGWENINDRRV